MSACYDGGGSTAKRRVSFSGFSVWHSQIVRTRQPRRRKAAAWRLSRAALPSSFFRHHARLVFGIRASLQFRCRCQKQPWPKCRCHGVAERCRDNLASRAGAAENDSPSSVAGDERRVQAWCPCRECGSSTGCAPADSKCLSCGEVQVRQHCLSSEATAPRFFAF
jgi:hypothetical protein